LLDLNGSNTYLRSIPSDMGILSLSSYLQFWAFAFFLLTLWLLFFKKEVPILSIEFNRRNRQMRRFVTLKLRIWTFGACSSSRVRQGMAHF
jgi:hypothetical protein